MKSKFFFLVLGLVGLVGTTDLAAQAATALKIMPKKANFIQDEGIVLSDAKLSTTDADALIALLKTNPAAGYLQVVDAKGKVQTYGTADINTAKLKGTTASSFLVKSGGGLAASNNCSSVIFYRCSPMADKSSMMFKAQALLNSYK